MEKAKQRRTRVASTFKNFTQQSMFFFHHAPELVRIIMNASSATARILSLAVLLLSLAPLGSIYVLFFSIDLGMGNGNGLHTYYDSSSSSNSSDAHDESQLAAVLMNPNATLEELWMALFHAQTTKTTTATHAKAAAAVLAGVLQNNNNNNEYFLLPVSAQSMHHLRMLMPWVLSLVLGVFVPCFVSLVALFRRRLLRRRAMQRQQQPRQQGRALNSAATAARETKLLEFLTNRLEPYTKILQASDRYCDATTTSTSSTTPTTTTTTTAMDATEAALMLQQWRIPEPAIKMMPAQQQVRAVPENGNQRQQQQQQQPRLRLVTGLCGICLDSFAETQAVSWSSNPDCVHCFHGTCIQSWLLRTYMCRTNISSKHSSNQCPCCRQSFLLFE